MNAGEKLSLEQKDDRTGPRSSDPLGFSVRENRRCESEAWAAALVLHYTKADIELLAAVDEAHETLSGPATSKILYREYHDFADPRYERLSSMSGSKKPWSWR